MCFLKNYKFLIELREIANIRHLELDRVQGSSEEMRDEEKKLKTQIDLLDKILNYENSTIGKN